MGLLYAGALPLVAMLIFGTVRGVAVVARDPLLHRSRRCWSLLYVFGWYTPVFRDVTS